MFSEFHARSAFSFLRGASAPEEMVTQALELGYRDIAITDHGGFQGTARAHNAIKSLRASGQIRAVVGATLDQADGSHLPVLCSTRESYQTLSRHLTDLHLADQAAESLRNSGLIALTGDRDGPVVRHLLRDDKASALAATTDLIATYGPQNVYVEINRHSLRDDGRLNRYLVDLAEHLRLPLLASNAPLHAKRDRRMLADAFTCLRHHVTLDSAGHLLMPNSERHLRHPLKMRELFADLPVAMENTTRLSDRIGFTLENLGYEFPDFMDAHGNAMTQHEQMKLLRELTFRETASRFKQGASDEVIVQLNKELEVIEDLGFPGYFLIVWELMEFARSRNIMCQGRGSAANSAVCHALKITNVDPIENRLLFERFLNDSRKGMHDDNRKSWPDIDIDFPSGEMREEVIQHVFKKYGARGAAMTANVITYRPRSAFREMSKVLGFPVSVADRFSKESSGFRHFAEDREEQDRTKEEDFDDRMASLLPPSHPRLESLSTLYHQALSLPRHLGQHSGGIIISSNGLDSVVPIQPATMPRRTIVQWDKDDCEDLGIVKIDLLGLGILAAMQESITICKSRGTDIDLAKLDLTDEAVYKLLEDADTIGTFQVESRAQMATLPILKPANFYDIAVEVAIIRPGPIVGDLLHPYLQRRIEKRNNLAFKPDCIHPLCKSTLERTLGVPLFQEQMLGMAMKVADFNGTQADDLRRALSFKRDDKRMQEVIKHLREGMERNNIPEEAQEKIIHATGTFALYGFPESHAISFAHLAFASCWLKVHHPAEFYVGLINNQPMGFYSVNTLLQDAKHRGMRILPVCCVEGGGGASVVDDRTIRLGLNGLKNVGKPTIQRILSEREARPFESLEDFLHRVKPAEKERRSLARSGALNQLPAVKHRRHAMWQAELPLHDDLFHTQIPEFPEMIPAMTLAERLSSDYAVQSASSGPHPMKLWRAAAHERKILRAVDLENLPKGIPVTVGGMTICRQRPGTAKGHCFISLEDETGIANLFVPRETFHHFRQIIVTEPFLLATGKLQRLREGRPTVLVTGIAPLAGTNPDQAAASHDFH